MSSSPLQNHEKNKSYKKRGLFFRRKIKINELMPKNWVINWMSRQNLIWVDINQYHFIYFLNKIILI
jgi:hypothetical protein